LAFAPAHAREVIAMIVDKVRAGVGRWAGGERERYATRAEPGNTLL